VNIIKTDRLAGMTARVASSRLFGNRHQTGPRNLCSGVPGTNRCCCRAAGNGNAAAKAEQQVGEKHQPIQLLKQSIQT